MEVDRFKHRRLAPTVGQSSQSLGELEGPQLQNQSTHHRPIKARRDEDYGLRVVVGGLILDVGKVGRSGGACSEICAMARVLALGHVDTYSASHHIHVGGEQPVPVVQD
jgi:hypothetical protein